MFTESRVYMPSWRRVSSADYLDRFTVNRVENTNYLNETKMCRMSSVLIYNHFN